MSKIIQAINNIIEHSDKITSVIRIENENFFNYSGHIMSIIEYGEGESYRIYIYPNFSSTLDVKSIENPRNFDHVFYDTDNIKGREALESFNNLYSIVAEKIYGVDTILDDIIGKDFK